MTTNLTATITTNLMSKQEEMEPGLPNIIKNLADQVVTRDIQLQNDKAKFSGEIASMKDQLEEMRLERNRALSLVEKMTLQENQLKADLNLEREVSKGKVCGSWDVGCMI
jgi:hypothetical protein